MHLATHWNTCEKLPLLVNFMGLNLLCQNIPALIFQFFGFQNACTFPKKISWFCSPTSIHIIIKTNLFLRHCIFLHASYPRSSLIAYLVQLQRTVFVSFIVYFLYTNWIYLVHRCIVASTASTASLRTWNACQVHLLHEFTIKHKTNCSYLQCEWV